MVDFKDISLEPEMEFWMEKAMEAVEARAFQPFVVGYWTPGSAIIQDQGSRHFCLAFTPPKKKEQLPGLCAYLKLQLLYNNAAACLYVGGQYVSGLESKTAIAIVGDNGLEKKCWILPFTMKEKETEFFQAAPIEPSQLDPWDNILPREEQIVPGMGDVIRGLHSHLLMKESLSEDGREVAEYFKAQGKENFFPKIPSEEIFHLCLTYIASRTDLLDL
ncbi:MAG: hypothetical protein Q8P59_01010 [Dehalococcoidia bacterium]|nr:hypothetical protein [Dehalococcoidia bacterium]